MSTQYVRESVHSRLFPFRQAIEELNSRREDGLNDFTNEEPAVERLLNALDFIFNTDVEHPGEFFDFMKCALESVQRQVLTHQPMENVLARAKHDDTVENFRLWLIYSLNLTGSLKQALHATLPMRDVLECFVRKDSILFMDTFIDEFLGTLATLHNPPIGEGQTTFKLDAGALQLFVERPIAVHVDPKRRTKAVKGGAVRARRPRGKDETTATRHGIITAEDDVPVRKRGTLASLPPVRLVEDGTQTDEVVLTHGGDAVVPVSANDLLQMTASSVRGLYVDASVVTDHPSQLMTFQELMEAQNEVEAFRAEQRHLCERLRDRENEVEELKRDYNERMELVVSTIRQLKSMYNELFMRSLEAQDTLTDFTEQDVDDRIVDVFYALKNGKTKADRAAVREALDGEGQSNVTRKRSGAVSHRSDTGSLSPIPSPRDGGSSNEVPAAEKKKSSSNATIATPTGSTNPPSSAALSAGSGTTTTTGGSPAGSRSRPAPSAPVASANIVNSCTTDESSSTPMSNHAIIPVDQAKLITTEPTEFERAQQMSLQANRCSGCSAAFGDGDEKNVVLKVVQKAGETLRLQKPRRCHYCVKLFCHRCHTNKMAVLPFRVLNRWDFAPQHVCNRDYEFLSKNADRAFYYLPTLPQELQSRPNIQQAAFLRKKLVLLCKIVFQCSHEKAAPFAAFLHSHYGQRENFYSLNDFSRLRTGEGNRLLMAASTPINAVGNLVAHAGGMIHSTGPSGVAVATAGAGPAPNEDLVSFLTTQFTKLMHHVKECRQCIARSSMRCGLCSESSPVSIVDDDGTQCKVCLSVYHVSCLEIAGGQCPACNRK